MKKQQQKQQQQHQQQEERKQRCINRKQQATAKHQPNDIAKTIKIKTAADISNSNDGKNELQQSEKQVQLQKGY